MGLYTYAKQILDIYNFYNGAIMVNRKGIIEYYYNNRKDINTISEHEVLGKELFEIYPSISHEVSTLIEVMRTGQSKINTFQSLTNYKGESYGAVCSTFPIFDGKRIIGAIEIFLYLEKRDCHLNIFITNSETKRPKQWYALDDIIASSIVIQELKQKIIKISHTDSTVMIFGETGTGKELVAQSIHANGERSRKRFISQNCAAIPENLFESILFGTVRGGFTGAENRMGLFEAANGGTLFFDEINSMDIAVQAKILKAIEEQKIVRVGGIDEIPIDVRVIVAMNLPPLKCVQNGTLREDLYYRLKVIQLYVPPLRARKDDILPLVEHYVDFFNRTMCKNIKGVTNEVLNIFKDHQWPGNIRELRNILESSFNICESEFIEIDDIDCDLLRNIGNSVNDIPEVNTLMEESLRVKVRVFESSTITKAVEESENLSQAAKSLGITRQTLNNKIRELNL